MKDSWDGDQDPLAALRAGRSGPFEAFVHAETSTFLGFFSRLGASRAEAEDLVQETFLKLFRTSAQPADAAPRGLAADPGPAESPAGGGVQYAARGQFSGYAFRVARNVWIDRVRKRASERTVPEGESTQGEQDQRVDPRLERPEEGAMRLESSERIRRAVESLPDSHREVFELAVVEELPYAAISEALEIPVGTVKSRMHNAVRRVRESLDEEDRVREAVRVRDAGRGGRAR